MCSENETVTQYDEHDYRESDELTASASAL